MTQTKLTIFLVGPCKCGKTAIANTLAEVSDSLSADYHPTQAVRILEFESKLASEKTPVSIELWDCSGSSKFASQIAAVSNCANSVVFIHAEGQERNMEQIYESTFSFLTPEQIHVFAHETASRPKYKVNALKNASTSFTSMNDGEKIRSLFDTVIATTFRTFMKNKNDEETNLLS